MSVPIETERKYLIKYPDTSFLESLPGVKTKHIVQTYLLSPEGVTSRVRKMTVDGNITYIKTEKRRINTLSCFEDEHEITEQEHNKLICQADPARCPINKTRYAIPHNGHILEIDIYDFWQDRATLEIELESETQSFSIPDFIHIIKEVTDDPRYKNANLARHIVTENL